MVEILTIFLVAAGLLLLYFIYVYNRLVVLRNRINNAWAQIDVQLKRRADLIPNLVETVKGYVKHEKTTLTELTKARTQMMQAKTLSQKAKANNALSETLKTLFAVAENYPTLKANENFLMLQEELSGTESKIAYARQFYNDSVLSLNTKIQTFPSSIIANLFKFITKEYFEIAEAEKKPVKVKF